MTDDERITKNIFKDTAMREAYFADPANELHPIVQPVMTIEEASQYLTNNSLALANDSFGKSAHAIINETHEAVIILRAALGLGRL
jgi:hypothetical protein